MIKKLKYIYTFLYFSSIRKFSLISFFPLLSVVIGSVIVFFTIAIMEGMEEAIFDRIESFNFTYTGNFQDPSLFKDDFDVYSGAIKKYLIYSNNESKIITVKSIDNFEEFKKYHIRDYLINTLDSNGIILGKGLARQLRVSIGEKISIASPLDASLFTGLIPIDKDVNVSGIFNYEVMDYDYNYAFMPNSGKFHTPNSKDKKIFLKSLGEGSDNKSLIEKYNLTNFKDMNHEFIKAINIEKLLYSLFGYIVIFIASASSISLMSLFIIQKKKQLAILKTLGFKNLLIGKVFIFNSIFISLLGVFIGTFFYALIIFLNDKYYFIQKIFFNNLSFDFLIRFNSAYAIDVFLISCFLMIVGCLYPIFKVLNINLANILNEKV